MTTALNVVDKNYNIVAFYMRNPFNNPLYNTTDIKNIYIYIFGYIEIYIYIQSIFKYTDASTLCLDSKQFRNG